MSTETRPNAELAYRVLDHIDAHREHFNMGSWTNHQGIVDLAVLTEAEPERDDEESCGTTACFAGWVVVMSGHMIENGTAVRTTAGKYLGQVETVAADLLGLGDGEDLFFVDEWVIEDAVEEIFGPRPGGAA